MNYSRQKVSDRAAESVFAPISYVNKQFQLIDGTGRGRATGHFSLNSVYRFKGRAIKGKTHPLWGHHALLFIGPCPSRNGVLWQVCVPISHERRLRNSNVFFEFERLMTSRSFLLRKIYDYSKVQSGITLDRTNNFTNISIFLLVVFNTSNAEKRFKLCHRIEIWIYLSNNKVFWYEQFLVNNKRILTATFDVALIW